MSLTADLRERLRVRQTACPTCGQPTGDSLRLLGEQTGVSFTVLARFLRGGDMLGRNLDLVAAFLEKEPQPEQHGHWSHGPNISEIEHCPICQPEAAR